MIRCINIFIRSKRVQHNIFYSNKITFISFQLILGPWKVMKANNSKKVKVKQSNNLPKEKNLLGESHQGIKRVRRKRRSRPDLVDL